jgi:hypothetical protein
MSSNAVRERFWRNVTGGDVDTCWLWMAGINGVASSRYGQFQTNGRRVQAHRFAWTDMRGEIPAGLELDHLCRVQSCVNPWHLDPVTHVVNVRRGRAVKTHCPHGHPYDEQNTYIHKGVRYCRACISQRKRLAYIRRQEASA